MCRIGLLRFLISCAKCAKNADINWQLQDELTDAHVDLEAQSLFKRKNLHDSAM